MIQFWMFPVRTAHEFHRSNFSLHATICHITTKFHNIYSLWYKPLTKRKIVHFIVHIRINERKLYEQRLYFRLSICLFVLFCFVLLFLFVLLLLLFAELGGFLTFNLLNYLLLRIAKFELWMYWLLYIKVELIWIGYKIFF